METKELKKVLARVGLAGLIAAGGVALAGCASTSFSGKKVEKETTHKGMTHSEKGKTSCSGGEKSEGKSSGDEKSEGGTSCSGMSSCA